MDAAQADRRAAELVARMTLPEKIAQLQSSAPAIPRLGVPAYDWWNEGLHGSARAGYATVFPQAIGLAASWNDGLLRQVGDVVSTEARAKYNLAGKGDHPRYHGLTIWSPNINIFRDPRWGRGQETYGEDPFLTGTLATAFVRGIQGDDPGVLKAAGTPKHFAVHSGPEKGRHGFDARVSPHDLEDTYLPAFRMAVTQGHAASVMCAYNALDGTPACASPLLLQERLRRDWQFTGYVVSDCDAVDDMTQFHRYKPDNGGSSAASVAAGTDLDCGVAYAALGDAVRKGQIGEAAIDQAARRLFAARYRMGMFDADNGPYAKLGAGDISSRAHRTLALQAARESIVLLKNERSTLPLQEGKRIAVIGPNADALNVLEANYHGTAVHPVTPLAGIAGQFGEARVTYAQGSTLAEGVTVPIPSTALRTGTGRAEPGLRGEYFASGDMDGKPALVRIDRRIDFDWDEVAPAEGLDAKRYAVRWTGELLPPGAGDYTLNLHIDRCFDCKGHDPVRLFVDGKQVLDDHGKDYDLNVPMHFADAKPHSIRLELRHTGEDQGIRLQWAAPAEAQLREAKEAIAKADAVVAVVGLSPDVEGEELQVSVPGFSGGDRTELALPAPQQRLLEAAAASGKPLVVVLTSGSAVALAWAKQHADAIMAAWYPGEAGGLAIADVLSGHYNPAGRLPVTFYASAKDLPAFDDYRMEGRTYRYFRGTPLFAFGDGLSYTRFAYDATRLSATTLKAGDKLGVDVRVRNSGDRDGDEVVQLYLTAQDAPAGAPRHSLVGFSRVAFSAGESKTLHFEIDPRQLSQVDARGRRRVMAGKYALFVGGRQPGASDAAATFTIQGTQDLPR
ncbi:glycoside hydrolase family 3 C-terminal domain-containing protein [Dyella sp. BiH032]|uniref:glycoside hydrolase family 3 C-terminal domain-containing protein n=1 Tax=Dyella sp. BiH032 TaxID=3075430 RepID=UPI002892E7AD|nr:glycoside hydrolase family 3 C-terminal domain-containing protein [Dyella sp. BiH032]WNL48206.1 glycoside hydrolase family 3 C-terminal domain-containing protein [Dyella sp. BiH032]